MYELRLLADIRYTTPVLTLQKQLATLRAWRRRNGLFFLYSGCFLWIPLMLMVFAGWGVDLWSRQPLVVAGFFVSGAVCALGVYLGLRWARRCWPSSARPERSARRGLPAILRASGPRRDGFRIAACPRSRRHPV